MYGWNGFFYKNVLSAAYNQVRFIVRNLGYYVTLLQKKPTLRTLKFLWVFGPIYLVDQKLGYDPKFGIWPNFWDLSQFLGIDPIFGKNPYFWDLQPLGQGIGDRGCP